MRRLTRGLFSFWCAISLLLFVATCVLWVRSHGHIDAARFASQIDAANAQSRIEFYSDAGVICVAHVLRERTIGPPEDRMGSGITSYGEPTQSRPFTGFERGDPQPLGFGLARSVTVDPSSGPWEQRWTHTAASAPHWFVALILLLSPARWAYSRLVTWRRRRAGQCAACGYDLRASTDRCPECGAPAGLATA